MYLISSALISRGTGTFVLIMHIVNILYEGGTITIVHNTYKSTV